MVERCKNVIKTYDVHVTKSIGINISNWTLEEQQELFNKLKEANVNFTIKTDNDISTAIANPSADSKEITDI